MVFHYAGKYNGDEKTLPQREHPTNSVPFREPENAKKLSIIANIGACILIALLAVPFGLVSRKYLPDNSTEMMIGSILSMVLLIPHEFLHAICFKKDVYLYHYLSKGLLFVAGTEDMSKGRFIFMSMLPNLIFGIIPYVLFYFFPQHVGLGMLGLISIGCGFGDYINVFNAATQMPKGSVTYMCGIHSYWYIP